MYDRVKRWVFEEGGRLIYLGGNGLNCEVELRPDDTMVVHNGQITSLWPAGMGGKESRFAMRHESEANLLGVVFTRAGAMTGAPYRVVDGGALGLRGHRAEGRRRLRREEPAPALPRRRVGPRDGQGLAVVAERTCICWRRA